MAAHHDITDQVVCVVSDEYLKAACSSRSATPRRGGRPGFVLLVTVKQRGLPTLSDHMRRCDRATRWIQLLVHSSRSRPGTVHMRSRSRVCVQDVRLALT
jgi:hypothetical protein